MTAHRITIRDINAARKAYAEREPRDLCYRAATTLIDLARQDAGSLTLAESLAVLLQTWNMAYYRYHPFDQAHFVDLERIFTKHRQTLDTFWQRSIEDFSLADETAIKIVFKGFEQVLGPVGASKSLHLLAPKFFPLWDRTIASNYGLALQARGWNAPGYCRFMEITKGQVNSLGGEEKLKRNPLKAIDEYNYCKAKGWT